MRATTTALAVVLALGLTGCGSGKDEAAGPTRQQYCAAVGKLAGHHRAAPRRFATLVQDAANVAYGETGSDWHDVATAVTSYAKAAERSMLDPARPPYGLDAAKTRRLDKRLLANAYRVNVGPVRSQVAKLRREIRSACGVGTTL